MSLSIILVFFPLYSVVAGIIIWSVRQEGRINTHDLLFDEREKQNVDRHDDVVARLVRIEKKLDQQNGYSQRGS